MVVFQNKRDDGTVYFRTDHEEEWGYKPTLVFTAALDGEGELLHVPAALPPRKRPVTDLQECGWAPGPTQIGAENLAYI